MCIRDRIDIGVGSYGLVTFGRYSTNGKQSRDVVIKIPRNITGYENEFAKRQDFSAGGGWRGNTKSGNQNQKKKITV